MTIAGCSLTVPGGLSQTPIHCSVSVARLVQGNVDGGAADPLAAQLRLDRTDRLENALAGAERGSAERAVRNGHCLGCMLNDVHGPGMLMDVFVCLLKEGQYLKTQHWKRLADRARTPCSN